MKAYVRISYTSVHEIDLEDYGHEPHVCFEDLTDDEQNEITDHLREDIIPNVIVETIKY